MKIPTIHLNGTGKKELLENICAALTAVNKAQSALSNAAPHPRDYYVQDDEAYKQARDEHFQRLTKLEEVRKDLEEIGLGINAQGRAMA